MFYPSSFIYQCFNRPCRAENCFIPNRRWYMTPPTSPPHCDQCGEKMTLDGITFNKIKPSWWDDQVHPEKFYCVVDIDD